MLCLAQCCDQSRFVPLEEEQKRGEDKKRTSYKIVSLHSPLTSSSKLPHSSSLSVSPEGTNFNSTCSVGLKRYCSRKSRYGWGRYGILVSRKVRS